MAAKKKAVKPVTIAFGVAVGDNGNVTYGDILINPSKGQRANLETMGDYDAYDLDGATAVEIHVFETTIVPPKVKPAKVKKVKFKKTKTVTLKNEDDTSQVDDNDEG